MPITCITTIEFPEDRRTMKISAVINALTEAGIATKLREAVSFEVYYVTAGDLPIRLDGDNGIVREGQILFVRPGQMFGIHKSVAPVSFFHCHFEVPHSTVSFTESRLKEWASLMSRMSSGPSAHGRSLHLPNLMTVSDRAAVTEMFAQLLRRQRERRHGFALCYEAQFLLLLQYISEQVAPDLAESKSRLKFAAPEIHVSRGLDFIQRCLSRDISLFDIARHLDVNAAYFSRIFKNNTGVTVGNYIVRKKVALAQERLLSTRMNIKQVAASLGFHDQRYFCRKFRRETGMSPREYQLRQHR